MRGGLATIPGATDLERAYRLLFVRSSRGTGRARQPTCAELALFSQWARFDPRLAEILVQYVIVTWRRIHPVELHQALHTQPWPGACAVLLEFAERGVGAAGGCDSAVFRHWKAAVTAHVALANWEQFFIGQRRIGGEAMQGDARFAFEEYRRWGYLAREILFNKQRLPVDSPRAGATGPERDRSAAGTHRLGVTTRLEILKTLLERSARLRARDYWEAIGRSVSLRQAERDLKASGLVRARGRTRARWFAKARG